MSKRFRARNAQRPEKYRAHGGASIVPRWRFEPGTFPVRAVVWDQLQRERAARTEDDRP